MKNKQIKKLKKQVRRMRDDLALSERRYSAIVGELAKTNPAFRAYLPVKGNEEKLRVVS